MLGNSIPEETDTINFSSKISCGIDLDVTCQCKNLKIYFWLAEATNWLPNIFSFLEAIICAKSNELFFYLDEEGIDTFLYVKRFDNNKIRFAHLTTRTQNGDYSSEGDFKIRMDVIINEKAFIKTFYNSIINAINGIDRQEIENDWNYQLEEYEILKSGSHLIEEYLS